ncbi:aldo/keto reductase [Pseudomonas lopnurensis]|uniref:aldo/keto reductase n=1 Tax=Pseudomonas lopnurensis TaxID=1477517 RepID=UPI0028AB3F15|nr:aldo/keto reductase [Pseudomonas lopnurensis]
MRMMEVALAWVPVKQAIAAPIVGATKPQHLEDAVKALQVKLAPQEFASWKLCQPHLALGFH